MDSSVRARLLEHPGDHDQRVHSPTGRAALGKEKAAYLGRKAAAMGKAAPAAPAGYVKSTKDAVAKRHEGPDGKRNALAAIRNARLGAARKASKWEGGPGGMAHHTAIKKTRAPEIRLQDYLNSLPKTRP